MQKFSLSHPPHFKTWHHVLFSIMNASWNLFFYKMWRKTLQVSEKKSFKALKLFCSISMPCHNLWMKRTLSSLNNLHTNYAHMPQNVINFTFLLIEFFLLNIDVWTCMTDSQMRIRSNKNFAESLLNFIHKINDSSQACTTTPIWIKPWNGPFLGNVLCFLLRHL